MSVQSEICEDLESFELTDGIQIQAKEWTLFRYE